MYSVIYPHTSSNGVNTSPRLPRQYISPHQLHHSHFPLQQSVHQFPGAHEETNGQDSQSTLSGAVPNSRQDEGSEGASGGLSFPFLRSNYLNMLSQEDGKPPLTRQDEASEEADGGLAFSVLQSNYFNMLSQEDERPPPTPATSSKESLAHPFVQGDVTVLLV